MGYRGNNKRQDSFLERFLLLSIGPLRFIHCLLIITCCVKKDILKKRKFGECKDEEKYNFVLHASSFMITVCRLSTCLLLPHSIVLFGYIKFLVYFRHSF